MATTDHKLRYAGAPHTATGAMVHEDTSITSGVGYARCSCGEMSGCLDSGRQRKAWHKLHKSLFQEGEELGELKPVEQVAEELGVELEDMQDKYMPAEEVLEDMEPAVEMGKLAEELHMEVAFSRANVAGIFWDQFGKLASKTVAEIHSVGVRFHNEEKITVFHGSDTDAVAAAFEDLCDMYETAKEVHKAWKKSDEDYKALQQSTKEGRKGAYRLTRDFWASYVQQSTSDLI